MIVRDGEGATRIAEVRVEGARTAAEADRIARTVAESPAREDGPPRRRPQLGPHPGRGGPRGRDARHLAVSHLDRRRAGWPRAGPRATYDESGGGRGDAARTRCGCAMRLGEGAGQRLDVDLRPLPRLRGHQRPLPELSARAAMKLWGGNYEAGSRTRRVLGVQPLVPVRPAPAARGDRGLARLRARARPLRRDPAPRRPRPSTRASPRCSASRGRPGVPRARRRGRPQLRRGRASARSWASSPGRATWAAAATSRRSRRCASGSARRDRRAARRRRADSCARSSSKGAERRRRGDARLHPHPRRRAHHLRPSGPRRHAWALVRDRERLRDARVRVDVLPLGSGALAGTALPLDRDALAKDLGFAAVSPERPRRGDGPRLRRGVRLRAAPSSRPTSRASPRTSSTSRGRSTASSRCPRPSPPARA